MTQPAQTDKPKRASMTREAALNAAMIAIGKAPFPLFSPEREAAFQRNLAEREANTERAERAASRRESMAEQFGNAWRHG